MLDWNTSAGLSLILSFLALGLIPILSYAVDDNRPPQGRSLFDKLYLHLEGYRVPFPFEKLVTSLGAELDRSSRPLVGIKGAILPLGRSLQRRAGYPDVFRFPRVVITVDGELRRSGDQFPPDTRDKLFLGFHEKANVLEIISYNEEAGRFEFQVAHDYAPGKTPRVLYANRQSCTACHQNLAPLFAEAPWDETQANASVSAKLKALLGDKYQGVPTSSTQDAPYDFDGSKGRANMFSVYQLGWTRLCGTASCRKDVLTGALRMRIDGLAQFPVKGSFSARWKKLWPRGLAIPNGQIPNRDPLFQKESLENLVEVESEFEPLNLRAPQELWRYEEANVERVFAGIAHFFSDAEVRDLREKLGGRSVVELVKGLDESLFSARPFPKRELLRAIYLAQGWKFPLAEWERPGLPDFAVDGNDAAVKTFRRQSEMGTFRRCAACHSNTIGVPPNFLNGDLAAIRKNLAHCSERIFYRLSMWNKPILARKKSPMPPLFALGITEDEWVNSGELKKIREYVERELKKKGVLPAPLLSKDFSSLPGCLP